jgi:membrane protein
MARFHPGDLWDLMKTVVREFNADDCLSMAASLAYYTVFSLAPLVVLVIVIAGLILTPEEATEAVNRELQTLIGPEGADQIGVMVANVQADQRGNLIARILGGALLVFGATGVMVQLQAALNKAWDVKPDPEAGGVKNFIFKRLLSFAMILGIAFLLLVSTMLTAFLSVLANHAAELLPPGISDLSLQAANFVASLIVVTVLFGAIFKIMPEAKIQWRDVAVGALITAILFTIGKSLIGVYLGNSNVGSAYGAASSLAILFVWVYYSAVIVLFGAEFTQVWTRRHGSGLEPQKNAVFVVREERILRGDEHPAPP